MTNARDPWEEMPLSKVGQWGSGGTPKSTVASFYAGNIPWIRSGDLPDGLITDHPVTISESGLEASSAKWVPEGSLLVAMYGATIGRLGITTYPVTTNQAVAFCKPNKELIDVKFLFWHLRSKRSELVSLGQGGAQPNISQDIIKKQPINLPPIKTQRKILKKIESVTSLTSGVDRELRNVPRLIQLFRDAVLRKAFEGGLTQEERKNSAFVPWTQEDRSVVQDRRSKYNSKRRGSRLAQLTSLDFSAVGGSWIGCCLADVAHLRVGYAFKSSWFSKDGPKLLRGANIGPGSLDWQDLRRLSSEYVDGFKDYVLRTGDIVIAMDRPLISTGLKIAEIGPEDDGALLVQRVASPVCYENVNRRYIWWLLNSPYFIDQISRHATGSDLPHISGNDILSFHVPLPPPAEQDVIVKRIEAALKWLEDVSSDYAGISRLLPRLNEAFLAKALAGDLK